MMDSIELTNAVADRLEDVPSHTVVSMHRIVKETLAVLVEHGFIAYDTTAVLQGEPDE
jgi:hypothetical protein